MFLSVIKSEVFIFFMNSFYFKTHTLLSGNVNPETGPYVNADKARKMAITIFSSGIVGNPVVTLEYPSPIFPGENVRCWAETITTGGYRTISGLSIPIPQIRAVSSGGNNVGTGYFWATVFEQN